MTVAPHQSWQNIKIKSNANKSQSSHINKIQQQNRFNIILANKKHILQRRYMELMREKDQVLSEFY